MRAFFKLSIYLILFLIIIISVITAIVVYLVKFDNQSFTGKRLKTLVLQYSVLIERINLNEPGDNKHVYTNSNTSSIPVVLAYSPQYPPSTNASRWISTMIDETTEKQVSIITIDNLPELSRDQNNETLKTIRNSLSKECTELECLFVVYAPKYIPAESNTGIVVDRDTIYMFRSAIDQLSEDTKTSERIEQSTLMHEWAHLLGVEHIDSQDCIMSDTINVHDRHVLRHNQIETEYCWETLYQIEQLRNN